MTSKAKAKAECIRVAVRVRPLSSKETKENRRSIVEVQTENVPNQIFVEHTRHSSSNTNQTTIKTYAFDHVFGDTSTQVEVYQSAAEPIVRSVLKGYNGTIFAYGQTGTGKTYTIEGKISSDENKGIIPRTFYQIMEHVSNAAENIEFLVRVSFLEIYQDEVYDLLSKERQKMSVKEGKHGFYVRNLSMYSVKCVKDMLKVLRKGQKTRAVGATAMNPGSSRSHCILTVVIESSQVGDDGKDHCIVGKLNLVDLAGSERQKKTCAAGERLQEAKAINLSLSALGNVIKALVNRKASHVPFRDSKLTRLLQDSLGGNTKTVMIANIGPADVNLEETMSTLRYANRAKNIKNHAKINEDPKDALIRKMKEELQQLKQQLSVGGSGGGSGGGGVAPVIGGSLLSKRKKTTVVEKRIIRKVHVWKGVSKEEVQELRLKAEKAKQRLQLVHKEDKEKYEEARMEAEQAAHLANDALQALERRLAEEDKKLNKLKRVLSDKENQMLKGGIALNLAKEQEQELHATNAELQETARLENDIMKKKEEIASSNLAFDHKFNSIQEEIGDKNTKLKQLFQKYQSKTVELNDCKEENMNEEIELKENISLLEKQLQLKNMIVEYFIPQKWLLFMEEHSQWDENIDQWRIPALEYSGNNMFYQREENIEDSESEVLSNAANSRGGSASMTSEMRAQGAHPMRPINHQRMLRVWKRAKNILKEKTEEALEAGAANGVLLEDDDDEDEIGHFNARRRQQQQQQRSGATIDDDLSLMADEFGLVLDMDMQSDAFTDDSRVAIPEEIQEAIHITLNTNIDPTQNEDKVYLSYGVDMKSLKRKKRKTRSKKKRSS